MLKHIRSIPALLRSENRKTIRSSVTWRGYSQKNGFLGALLIVFTATLVWQIIDLIQYPRDSLTLGEFFFFAYYLVYAGYFFAVSLHQQLRLLHHADRYIFREVILDRPQAQYRSVTFTVVFTDEEGQKCQMETVPTRLTMVDHVNRTALVGYNPETKLAVIIRPLSGNDSPSQ